MKGISMVCLFLLAVVSPLSLAFRGPPPPIYATHRAARAPGGSSAGVMLAGMRLAPALQQQRELAGRTRLLGGSLALRAAAKTSTSLDVTPVTLLSGFLGTGKTTALKHLLENKEGLRVGVIVNDVAEVNIDARLISGYDAVEGSSTIELENGCACCSLSDELFKSVEQLLDIGRTKNQPFDQIVIELSGVAEPSAVKANFEEARAMGVPSALEVAVVRVVTVVDTSEFIDLWMTDKKVGEREDLAGDAVDDCAMSRSIVELLAEQIEAADRVVLNKVDMATAAQLRTAQDVVKGITRGNAQVTVAEFGKVPITLYFDGTPPSMMGTHGEDHGHSHEEECQDPKCTDESHGHSHGHSHDADCADETCKDESHGHSHAHSHDADCADETCKDESHGHSHGHSHDADCADETCKDESHGHSHSHASPAKAETTAKKRFGIDNFVYRARRPFAMERLVGLIKKWPIPRKNFDTYLDLIMDASNAAAGGGMEAAGVASESPLVRVIRSKGFVWVDSQPRQSLFWSHAGRHFSLDQAGKWWAEASDEVMSRLRQSRGSDYERMMRDEWEGEFGDRRQEIVFIGAGMSQQDITAALDKCLLDDSELDEFRQELREIIELEAKLRFREGDRVVCRCEKWEAGTVIKVGYREDSWPIEQPEVPYQVRLDSGALIWVPADEDAYVRKE